MLTLNRKNKQMTYNKTDKYVDDALLVYVQGIVEIEGVYHILGANGFVITTTKYPRCIHGITIDAINELNLRTMKETGTSYLLGTIER